MPILPAFLAAMSLVGTVIGLYYWHNSYRGTTTRRYSRLATLIGAIVFLTLLFVNIPFAFGGNGLQITPTPTTSNPQIGAGSTPTQVSQSFSPTPIPPTPTPAPKPGDVLYQANWSNGLNGWAGSPDWKALNGMLLNDGTTTNEPIEPTIVAPYDLGAITNYAVEATIQASILSSQVQTSFGISVRGSSTPDGWQGYRAYVGDPYSLASINTLLILAPGYNSFLAQTAFNPGENWHTYRVEVNGNSIKVFVDGALMLQVTDNRYLTGGQVGLWSRNAELTISSFKIIAV